MSDVCLLLEGTFPYVTGGVSSCVYQLINNTPHINYQIVFIGAKRDRAAKYKYEIPENVKQIVEVYLYDDFPDIKLQKIGKKLDIERLRRLYQNPHENVYENFKFLYHHLIDSATRICHPYDLFSAEESWQLLTELYPTEGQLPSFIDYFYTWRFSHLPVINLLLAEIPSARVYHALCTGYAGLLGAVAALKYKRPYFITEHGIYTHERDIEITNADWIYTDNEDLFAKESKSFFKQWWITIFQYMSRVAYESSDVISTLYYGNQVRQREHGAPPEKLKIIPNGINIERYTTEPTGDGAFLSIGLIGRVVPIKDIKLYIKAVKIVAEKVSNLRAYIIGPLDEDEEYVQECRDMVRFLALDETIIFTGRTAVMDYYPRLALNVLSSISEGQPMVILEGYCSGIPVVSTDVGGCKELVYGLVGRDDNLGPSGTIVPLGDAEALANAISELLLDEELRQRYSKSARLRVTKYYREEDIVSRYNAIYQQLMADARVST